MNTKNNWPQKLTSRRREEKIKMIEKEVTVFSIQYVLRRENYIFVSLI